MRTLSSQMRAHLNNGARFAFAFEIELTTAKKLYLTNFSNCITLNGITYVPNSSLQILRANFNDSAHDFVELSGIFDDAAISFMDAIEDAKIDIYLVIIEHNLIEKLLSLYCFSIQKCNLQFTLYLKNKVTQLGQNATRLYSKTCRANLGDAKCGVRLETLGAEFNVLHISANSIAVNLNTPSGYYDYGKVRFVNGFEIFILKQHPELLILSSNVPFELQNVEKIKIFPGCDKRHETCYNKFKNTLNFRGEPFVPEFNYEKIF